MNAAAFLEQSLQALASCTRRLERSLAQVAPLFPMTSERVGELELMEQDDLDAFLKRFEQTISTVQDQVFRSLVILDERDFGSMSRRDVAELMEKQGVIPSSLELREMSRVRNRLAHVYPHDPELQARTLNDAHRAASRLREVVPGIDAAARRRVP